jgi:hypothetical protein
MKTQPALQVTGYRLDLEATAITPLAKMGMLCI